MPYASVDTLPDRARVGDRLTLVIAPLDFAALDTAFKTGATRVENIPVFRAGTFKDSKGDLATWTTEDLDAMVANFNALRDNKVFVDVPVREDHTRSVKNIVGYYAALRRIGNMLYADLEITEPAAAEKYGRGTYRSRSIEIGAYEANDGQVYWPTVMGLAFCDISAVEGLFSNALSRYSDGKREIQVFSQSDTSSGDEPGSESQDALTNALGMLRQAAATFSGDKAQRIQQVIEATEAISSGVTAASPASAATHPNSTGAESMDSFTFSLGDETVEIAGDENTKRVFETFAAAHEDTKGALTAATARLAEIENERKAEKGEAREARVDRWLHEKRIVPAQVDGMKTYVKTLNDEQFTAHAALVESAPVVSLTVDHTAGGGNAPDADEQRKQDEVRDHTATLRMLKFTGQKTPEQLRESTPYKALVALGVTPEV